jgi:hypothetical protein
MPSLTHQEQFIHILKELVPGNVSLANEIASVLNISMDSTYRRLRGETELTINEVVKLCHHFDVPLEALNDQLPGVVTFKFTPVLDDEESFHAYLKGLYEELNGLQKFENKRILFAAEDVPVFHHFSYPHLSAFKLTYWMKSILNVASLQNKHYHLNHIDAALLETAKQAGLAYSRVPSTEIWTDETIMSNLKHIRFYWDAGFFTTREDALLVIEDFREMLKQVQRQVETGKKFTAEGTMTAVDYTFYLSDLMFGNNCVLIKADDKISSFISYNSFNSMRTTNRFFNEQNERWMNNLISKSTLLSGVAEKLRNQFFKSMFKKVDELIQYINE